jgi:hypothetical protein
MAPKLTPEEVVTLQVLKRKGQSNTRIAQPLGITEGAVRYHVRRQGTEDGRKNKPRKADPLAQAIDGWVLLNHPAADCGSSAAPARLRTWGLARRAFRPDSGEGREPGRVARAEGMTEQEWLESTDARRMLHFTTERDGRKLRLFACNCCYSVGHLLEDQRSRRAVEVAEQFADGLATNSELQRARYDAQSAFCREEPSRLHPGGCNAARAAHAATKHYPHEAAWDAAYEAGLGLFAAEEGAEPDLFDGIIQNPFRPQHSDWLRDIFGPLPFRPVALDPAWLSWNGGTIPKLAEAAYQERAFDRLPVLADALEEAGCTNAEILAHCRGPGPHTRGCWVVDLLLRKGW